MMEFETESPDYSVPEFYRKYGHILPQLVLVSQGFYGDIVEDTFDKNQVLRIQTVARQRRVVVKWGKSGQVRMYSLPLSFEGKMCVINKLTHKPGKEKTIQQIVNKHTLPVVVHFPKDRTLLVSGQNLHTNRLPNLELVQVFEEMYLMGNFVFEGTVGQDVVPVPLYLSELRLARCTGIKQKPEDEWTRFLASMTRKCSTIQYNQDFGNPNIAVYNNEAVHNETEYSYAEPATYTSLYNMFRADATYDVSHEMSADMSRDETQDVDGNVYELIQESSSSNKHIAAVGLKKSTDGEKLKPISVPPPILPKPSVIAGNRTPQTAASNGGVTPSLPPRNARGPSKKKEQTPVPVINHYANDIPTTTVAPMTADTHASRALPTSPEETCVPVAPPVEAEPPEASNSGSGIAETRDKTVTCGEDIEKLNISEVGEYLKSLQLDKHVDTFKDEMIDGPMLRELDSKILKEAFGMNVLEVIRLMKFIRDGHVPS